MKLNWALLLYACIFYLFYNTLISFRIKNILTNLNYKIRYKFVFLAHMAGMINNNVFSQENDYSTTTMTALSNKNIPLPIGAIATNTHYKTKYTSSLTIIAWACRFIEWVCVLLFSIIIMITTIYKSPAPPFLFSSTISAILTIFAFELLAVFIISFIEYIIDLLGLKTLKSLNKSQNNLFEHYNAIDGDIDEKAYNSDVCVQKYFQRRKTSLIKKLINTSDKDIILDIGCGSGVQLRSLDVKSPNILLIGTDISQNALQYAKNKNIPNTEFIRCNAEYLPFKTNTINKIICAELIEHLQNPVDMINESKRVLKDNGSMIITTPNENSIWGIYEFLWDKFGRGRNYGETHLRFFSIKDLNNYFSSFTTKSAFTIFFISPFIALLNNKTLLTISRYFDMIFEKLHCGVSIIYYTKKK
jgi:ubiquinone/menaquinone biosynthesis C-methylase UbiE